MDESEVQQDYLLYAALCGLFPPERNILKYWSKNNIVFENLIKKDESFIKNQNLLMFSLARYFVVTYNSETSRFAQTLLKEGIIDKHLMTRE